MPGWEAAPASRELGTQSGRRGSGLREVLRPPTPIPHHRNSPPGSLNHLEGILVGGGRERPLGRRRGQFQAEPGPRGVTFLSCGPSPLINGTEAEEGKRKPPRSARGETGPSEGPRALQRRAHRGLSSGTRSAAGVSAGKATTGRGSRLGALQEEQPHGARRDPPRRSPGSLEAPRQQRLRRRPAGAGVSAGRRVCPRFSAQDGVVGVKWVLPLLHDSSPARPPPFFLPFLACWHSDLPVGAHKKAAGARGTRSPEGHFCRV